MALSANAVVTAFNLQTGVKASRNMLITCFNTGTVDTPVWEVLGSGVTDSSISYSPDTSTETDILGITTTDVNGVEMTQDLSPMTIKGGQMLPVQIEDIVARKAWGEFSVMELLVIKKYISGDATESFYAERHKNCTIYPQSLGGSSTVDMPLSITFSNDKTLGEVVETAGKWVFTPTP